MGKYQPIKLSKSQYIELKRLIRKEFGNISIPKGLYILTHKYSKHIPFYIRDYYRKRYINYKKRWI